MRIVSSREPILCIHTDIQISPPPKDRENEEWKCRQKHMTDNWKGFGRVFWIIKKSQLHKKGFLQKGIDAQQGGKKTITNK